LAKLQAIKLTVSRTLRTWALSCWGSSRFELSRHGRRRVAAGC